MIEAFKHLNVWLKSVGVDTSKVSVALEVDGETATRLAYALGVVKANQAHIHPGTVELIRGGHLFGIKFEIRDNHSAPDSAPNHVSFTRQTVDRQNQADQI